MNNNQEDERFASLISKRLSETTRHELLNFAQGKQPKTFTAFSWRTFYFLTGAQLLARWKMFILRAVLFAAFLIIAWLVQGLAIHLLTIVAALGASLSLNFLWDAFAARPPTKPLKGILAALGLIICTGFISPLTWIIALVLIPSLAALHHAISVSGPIEIPFLAILALISVEMISIYIGSTIPLLGYTLVLASAVVLCLQARQAALISNERLSPIS